MPFTNKNFLSASVANDTISIASEAAIAWSKLAVLSALVLLPMRGAIHYGWPINSHVPEPS